LCLLCILWPSTRFGVQRSLPPPAEKIGAARPRAAKAPPSPQPGRPLFRARAQRSGARARSSMTTPYFHHEAHEAHEANQQPSMPERHCVWVPCLFFMAFMFFMVKWLRPADSAKKQTCLFSKQPSYSPTCAVIFGEIAGPLRFAVVPVVASW